MAVLAAAGNGNWNTAGTWNVIDTGTYVDSDASSFQLTSTSTFDSPTFAPGAITIDGVGLKSFAAGYNAGATLTVTLRNSTDSVNVVSVTVGYNDIGARGWFFVYFGSQLLVAGKNYVIRLQASVSNIFRFYGPAGTNNYSRYLRTTTASGAAPAASDTVFVCGEVTGTGAVTARTVTMDNTNTGISLRPTAAGTWPTALGIGAGGTLTWSTAGSEALYLAYRGLLHIGDMGAMLIGVEATPLPNTSTAVLHADSAANADSALYVFGRFEAWSDFTRTPYTRLSSAAAASQANIVVDANSNWQTNDQLAIAYHAYDLTRTEERTIASQAGATVTLNSNLTYAHDRDSAATAPFVANLTRPITLSATSTTTRPFFDGYDATSTGQRGGYFKFKNVCAKNMGNFQNSRRGAPRVNSTLAYGHIFKYYVCWGCDQGIDLLQAGSPSVKVTSIIDYHVSYKCQYLGIVLFGETNHAWEFTNSLIMHNYNDYQGASIDFVTSGCKFNGNSFTHTYGQPIWFSDADYATLSPIEDITVLTCRQSAIYWETAMGSTVSVLVFRRMKVYRMGTVVTIHDHPTFSAGVIFEDCEFRTGDSVWNPRNTIEDGYTRFIRCTLAGESATYPMNYVLYLTSAGNTCDMCEFVDCDFSAGDGINTAFFRWSVPRYGVYHVRLVDCAIDATMLTALNSAANAFWTNQGWQSRLTVDRVNRTQGEYFRAVGKLYTAANDTVIYRTASPSERVYPRVQTGFTSHRLVPGAVSSIKQIPMTASVTRTVSVYVRKSAVGDSGGADYNGAEPKLILRLNDLTHGSAYDDVTLDTMTAAVGNWEQLTAVIPAPSQDCVVEAYVECFGTVGWINVDDWSIT